MGGVGSCELCAWYVWFSYPPSGRERCLLSLGWWGWAHDLHAHRMVWLWTSYSRALMPAGSLGPASVGIVSRETRLSHSHSINEIVSERQAALGRKLFQPPPLLLGIPGAAVSLELCSSGDTLMRCMMHPIPIQPDAD